MKLARILIGFAVLSVSLLAQAPSGPLFVRLDVIALDSKGQPVTDLGPNDFQVTDQGKAQKLVYFHRKSTIVTPGPGELSNRAARPAHSTIILFDLMSQPYRNELLDSLKRVGKSLAQLESGESIYLYVLAMDGTLLPIHPLPPKPAPPTAEDKTWTKNAEAIFEKITKEHARVRPAGMSEEIKVKKTYVAMETLARQLAYFSGEHEILWVMRDVLTVSNPKTTTCTGDWLDCALYIPHLTLTLARAVVPVNPIFYGTSNPDQNRGMVDFSALVGGRPFFGNDIKSVLERLPAEAAGGYSLGFEEDPQQLDQTLHRVKVTTERKGLKLETRQRYVAIADGRPPMARAQEALIPAMQSPYDDPQIGLRIAATKGPKSIQMKVKIDPADLVLKEQGGVFTGNLISLVSGYNADGPVGTPVDSSLTPRLTKEQRETALKDGLPLTLEFPIDATIQKVRVMIYDTTSGAVGSLSVPVSK